MAALFPKIYDVVDGNPFRDIPIEVRPSREEQEAEAETETERWDCFFQTPLNPPGSLSQFLLHQDPLYEAASPSLRKQIQTEKLLEIQERVENELVGRRWPRKKIHDALGEQINSSSAPFSELVEEVLCDLYHFQKIIIHRKSKSISFCPSDLRLWKSDTPIYVGDDDGCWSYEAVKPKGFLQWLTEKEEESWKVKWPTADGKMEELKSEVLKRNLLAHPLPGSDKKVKKEDWARVLGRCQAIETLGRLKLVIQ